MPWVPALVRCAMRLGATRVVVVLQEGAPWGALPAGALSAHSKTIVTFCLCGFANFGSLGILVGGMGSMVPERRAEIVALGTRSMVSGTLATCLSGAVAGLLI